MAGRGIPQITRSRILPGLAYFQDSRYAPASFRSRSSVLPLRRPNEPRDHHDRLERNSSPQSSNKSNRAMCPHATSSRASQKQQRRSNPAIALRIVLQPKFEQARIREQVAIIRSQHRCRQARVLQRPRCHRLACRLKCHECNGESNIAVERG